jgi:hypothetical protein
MGCDSTNTVPELESRAEACMVDTGPHERRQKICNVGRASDIELRFGVGDMLWTELTTLGTQESTVSARL